jgi:hypothetical protein
VKFPDRYVSKIGPCANKLPGKIAGMKSHNCHVFLQRLLPIAIHGYLTTEIRTTLIELNNVFLRKCERGH